MREVEYVGTLEGEILGVCGVKQQLLNPDSKPPDYVLSEATNLAH